MKKSMLLLWLLPLACLAQAPYWQQQADFTIDATLHPADKTVDGFEQIRYTNHSPDTLRFIWFHVWMNAYKNDRTAYTDQALRNGHTEFYFADRSQWGYVNRLDFRVDGMTAKTEDHPEHIDIIRLVLPRPLPPGGSVQISTPFHVQLPFNFSRGGYSGKSFQLTQWYPKPAVYDREGWHPMPYLDQGEFYSEFGSYEVRLTVPSDYVVAATGQLQEASEKDWLETRKPAPVPAKKSLPGKKPPLPTPSSMSKTLTFRQDRIHDFAWFASPDYVVDHDTCRLPSGRIVDVYAFYTPDAASVWKKATGFARDALQFYSREVGEYPYDVVSIVLGPESNAGGMEYPTITSITPTSDPEQLDIAIAHEVGHNWFYGVLASNERDHPWMDEGINTFYEYRYIEEKYGSQSRLNELLFQTKALNGDDQPIETASEAFTESNYFLSAYHKTAEWMRLLERKLGKEPFRALMQSYYRQWQFRHPLPSDFRDLLKENAGAQADSLLAYLGTKGILPGNELHGFRFISPLKPGSIKGYFHQPSHDILLVSPALSANSYDRISLGLLVSNYKIPPAAFQYFVSPLYALGTKTLVGRANLNYSLRSTGRLRRTDLFVNGARFTMDEVQDSAGRKLYQPYHKIVPGIRFSFHPSDPLSTVRSELQWKTFFIRETGFTTRRDTQITGTDTALLLRYLFPKEDRTLHQIRFTYENFRGLYPFDLQLQIEGTRQFLRPTLTAHYFFNYREGGMELRFFAGKFLYLNGRSLSNQFLLDRYLLNMSGPNGYEDYTYSDWFLGRNRFEGLASQQLMIRDGAFKVRTDLLQDKVGKTDNWLTSLNFNASLPKKWNPLSVLPVHIPLHLFLDLGTYAEAWEEGSEKDRILYDFGFHIPIARGFLNFYFPLLYNRAYSDYYKQNFARNRLFHSMTFSINLATPDLQKLRRELEF